MADLDAIARRLHQAVKDLTPAVPKAPAAAPAPTAPAPVAAKHAPADRPQHATFYRDQDTGRALHVDVQFQKGVVRITPGFDDDGLMAFADFTAIQD